MQSSLFSSIMKKSLYPIMAAARAAPVTSSAASDYFTDLAEQKISNRSYYPQFHGTDVTIDSISPPSPVPSVGAYDKWMQWSLSAREKRLEQEQARRSKSHRNRGDIAQKQCIHDRMREEFEDGYESGDLLLSDCVDPKVEQHMKLSPIPTSTSAFVPFVNDKDTKKLRASDLNKKQDPLSVAATRAASIHGCDSYYYRGQMKKEEDCSKEVVRTGKKIDAEKSSLNPYSAAPRGRMTCNESTAKASANTRCSDLSRSVCKEPPSKVLSTATSGTVASSNMSRWTEGGSCHNSTFTDVAAGAEQTSHNDGDSRSVPSPILDSFREVSSRIIREQESIWNQIQKERQLTEKREQEQARDETKEEAKQKQHQGPYQRRALRREQARSERDIRKLQQGPYQRRALRREHARSERDFRKLRSEVSHQGHPPHHDMKINATRALHDDSAVDSSIVASAAISNAVPSPDSKPAASASSVAAWATANDVSSSPSRGKPAVAPRPPLLLEGRKVRIYPETRVQKALDQGDELLFVECIGCSTALLATLDTDMIYCPTCGTLSNIHSCVTEAARKY